MPAPGENLRINAARLWDSLDQMAQIGPGLAGGNNRQTLTDADSEGRHLFAHWCKDAGMTMGVDTMGNMFATRAGTDPSALPVYMGSHLDTQPTGGRYDGVLGVLGAFIVSYVQTGVNWQTLRNVIIGTVQSCSMMGMIILGASLLGNITAALGVPDAVAQVVTSWELSPLMLIVALMMLYLLLGTALEGFAMIACTLPVVLPLVIAAGFDKVWFGIFLVLVVEMAQITPPVAFNLSVLQGITGKSMTYLTRVTLPYLFIMMGFVILIAVFPGIVLWFPNFILNK